jgi:hypothetical protein
VYFVAMRISGVGHNFVGETERRLLALKNDCRRICALRHKVGEIDPRCQSLPFNLENGDFVSNSFLYITFCKVITLNDEGKEFHYVNA